MKVKDFIRLSMDTTVRVRDRKTGEFIEHYKDFADKEVTGFYAKEWCFDDGKKIYIIVMAR